MISRDRLKCTDVDLRMTFGVLEPHHVLLLILREDILCRCSPWALDSKLLDRWHLTTYHVLFRHHCVQLNVNCWLRILTFPFSSGPKIVYNYSICLNSWEYMYLNQCVAQRMLRQIDMHENLLVGSIAHISNDSELYIGGWKREEKIR